MAETVKETKEEVAKTEDKDTEGVAKTEDKSKKEVAYLEVAHRKVIEVILFNYTTFPYNIWLHLLLKKFMCFCSCHDSL